MSAVAQRGPLPRRLSLLAEALVARGGVVLLAIALPAGSYMARFQAMAAQMKAAGFVLERIDKFLEANDLYIYLFRPESR